MNCEKCSETLPIFVSLEGNESTCDIVIVKDVSPASFNKIRLKTKKKIWFNCLRDVNVSENLDSSS